MGTATRVLILGAAGRDFHNFNLCYRDRQEFEVVAFTATQIPNIDGRRYPASLAGSLYPHGIPILPEDELPKLMQELNVDQVVFAYSDVSHEDVMHHASIALAMGADFVLLGPRRTMLKSNKPVISVGAVRTGVGKGSASRRVVAILRAQGWRVVVIRHPMPYGDLTAQRCQRFASNEDFDRHHCTIEEREEFEPHVAAGTVVFAGVDYQEVLTAAEAECDVIVWEGGNNDLPFLQPDLHIVLADPYRAGHERLYHPGEANVRMADLVIITKADSAPPEGVQKVRESIKALNAQAPILLGDLSIELEAESVLAGRRALVIEDGPTLTHGEMSFGAGVIAARRAGAVLVDPRPWAAPRIAEAYRKYPHLGHVLPAMGYDDEQLADLSKTIASTPADVIVCATPVDLGRLFPINRPVVRVSYSLREHPNDALVGYLLARVKPKLAQPDIAQPRVAAQDVD